MNQYTVIGILAHVDAGKTTLSEALLFQAGVIRKQGRVDHKDAFLDTNPLERERGITIFSKQAILPLPEKTITLLDTPGHVAQVTTTLAQKNVNIATMQLYRNTQGGYAVMILECDDIIPKNTLEWLQDLDGIIKVTSYNVEEEV